MSTAIPTLSVTQLQAWLHACYNAGVPSMTYGPPGIGKSELHAQFAREINHAMLEVRLSYFLPETMGPILYPLASERKSVALKPAIIAQIEDLHATTGLPVLVFLDEITTATSEVLKTALEFVLEGRIAGFKPSCPVHIVAAGNSPEDTPEAIYLPVTHRTRLFSCLFKPTLADLARHVRNEHTSAFADVVAGFLRTPEAARLMNSGPPADGIDPVPVPRSIVRALRATDALAKLHVTPLEAIQKDDVIEMVWRSAVGDTFWQRLAAHAVIAANSVNPGAILKAPKRAAIPASQEATVTALNQLSEEIAAQGYDAKMIGALLDYTDRLSPESVRVWANTAFQHRELFSKLGGTVRGKRTLQAWQVELTDEATAARKSA